MAVRVKVNPSVARQIRRSEPVLRRLEAHGRAGQRAAGGEGRVQMQSALGKNRARVTLFGTKADLRKALDGAKRR